MIQDQHLDKVLAAVQSHTEEQYPEVIREAADWCHLYHLSRARTQLIEWIPIGKEEEILEVGSECGALTGELAKQCAVVTALELDPVKTEINRVRHREQMNITFVRGTLPELLEAYPERRYDKIFLIGSLPLAEQYMPKEATEQAATDDSYLALLKSLKLLLKPDGRLILSLPNKLGLKYFAGCREDYFGAPFTGLEDYYYHKGMKTFGKKELSDLLAVSGFPAFRFYYPYPDYRFAGSIYSDERLPQAGELNTNLVNFDQDRFVFFDEMKVFDNLIKEGLFPELANSFLVITGEEPVSDLIYTKYSAERSKRFALRTDIRCTGVDGVYAAKTPLTPAASAHVRHIVSSYESLKKYYVESGLAPCGCTEKADRVEFTFLSGETLQQYLERCVIAGNEEEVERMVESYRSRVAQSCTEEFRMTDGFREVFGEVSLPEHLLATTVSDIDLIFSNIIVPDWEFIDYEWTFDFPVPLHFLLYRAYFFASHQIQPCEALSLKRLLEKEGIGEDEAKQYDAMERHFQSYVLGETYPERDLLSPIGNRIIPITDMENAYLEKQETKRRFPDLRRHRQRV